MMTHNVDVNANQILVIHPYIKPTNLTCVMHLGIVTTTSFRHGNLWATSWTLKPTFFIFCYAD